MRSDPLTPAFPEVRPLIPRLRRAIRAVARVVLVRVGRRTRSGTLTSLRSVLSYLEFGRWLESIPASQRPRELRSDFEVFTVGREHVGGRSCLYLEFGVYAGRTMRWWAAHQLNSDSRFVGFDVFTGLPEGWRELPAGHFATDGPPDIDDPRVTFEVGLFEDTLRDFVPPAHDRLVINIDSDLYSSARTVLEWAVPYLEVGSLLYFDEFADRDHEMRAYFEFLDRTGAECRALAYAAGGTHVLFEITRKPVATHRPDDHR